MVSCKLFEMALRLKQYYGFRSLDSVCCTRLLLPRYRTTIWMGKNSPFNRPVGSVKASRYKIGYRVLKMALRRINLGCLIWPLMVQSAAFGNALENVIDSNPSRAVPLFEFRRLKGVLTSDIQDRVAKAEDVIIDYHHAALNPPRFIKK